ncbi:hypothetical protein ID866_11705 [Astraeus odoratus]|nr:hypothetical protein ID866_11705 [Astraeus odoratus]
MDPKKLCKFLVQCELNFYDRPQAFHLDMWKVGFAFSFLKGIALTWFEPDLLDAIPGTEPAWANDYSEFVIKLTTNFSPHDPVGNAEHQLDNLLMKDSSCINKYIIDQNQPSALLLVQAVLIWGIILQAIWQCIWHLLILCWQRKESSAPILLYP